MQDFCSLRTSHRHCKMAEKILQNIPAVGDIVDMQLKVTIEEGGGGGGEEEEEEIASFLGSVCVFCKETALRKVPFNR